MPTHLVKPKHITINGKVVLNEKWQEKGIAFINDIMKTNGNGLMSGGAWFEISNYKCIYVLQ